MVFRRRGERGKGRGGGEEREGERARGRGGGRHIRGSAAIVYRYINKYVNIDALFPTS